jgi:segregation and condensation protein A
VSLAFQSALEFSAAADAGLDEALIVDLDGFEGPLDVLLALARAQKVDLLKLSVARLAEQYLAFVREARRRRFALAADYLVMAAWLAYLKSRLLLPKPAAAGDGDLTAEDEAGRLAFRIAKLDAMRRAAEALEARPILRRDVFPRGDPEAARIVSRRPFEGDLYELMSAYVAQRRRREERRYRPPSPATFRLDEAREHLRELLPALTRWTALSGVAPARRAEGPSRASCVASTLAAGLELVREGALEARQLVAFEEVYLRGRKVSGHKAAA